MKLFITKIEFNSTQSVVSLGYNGEVDDVSVRIVFEKNELNNKTIAEIEAISIARAHALMAE